MTTRPLPREELRAVLLDSGGVLMRPIGGRWNPRADFEQTVLAHAPSITAEQFAAAIAAGDRLLAESSPEPDDYHQLMLREVEVDPTPELLAGLRPLGPPCPDWAGRTDVPALWRHSRSLASRQPNRRRSISRR
ncbi:hypothetical protein [Kitasatospora sp. NPDC050463]|uniref:hypothetical protein n=1 Tax=Kitasatospora sp. NPDC050463 TaxID=3155786 RepID=UPI00340C5B78